ncbi:hypothetical protein Pfo_003485 [Paulownia fortunei]|nr:hypothetical protein Pfo_003485 [Paulownia fortunei]
MAGMLPGVEAARRRRFHQSNNLNNGGGSTRRSSFCLYANNYHEFHINSASSMERNPIREAGCDDEKLEAAAREAKKRLDHRLQTLWKSEIKREQKGRERSTSVEGRLTAQGHFQTDMSTSMRKTGYQSG